MIGGAFTDEGMKSISGMRALKSLDLMCALHMDPRVTDAGIAHLGRLTKLQRLGTRKREAVYLVGPVGPQ